MLNLLPIIWMFLQWLLYARESAVLGRSPFWREASGRARETCPGWSEDRKAEAYLLCRFSGVTLVTALQQWLQQLPAWSCWGQCPCNKAVHTGFTSWCFCGAAVLPVPFVLGMPCLGSSWVSCLVTPSLRLCMKIARKSGDLLSHFGRGCWCLGDRHSSYSGVQRVSLPTSFWKVFTFERLSGEDGLEFGSEAQYIAPWSLCMGYGEREVVFAVR